MSSRVLWYATRGSGVVALLLLTAAVVLGVISALRWRGERWPRFAVTNAHRNLTLLSIVFVAVHVVTTVADGYAPIGLQDAVVPFLSPYRPIWLGLGAVSFDLLLALVATSLLRARIAPRLWRGVHWLAYAAWPVALLHSFGTGSDARFGWMTVLGLGCLAAVALAALARATLGGGLARARVAGAATALVAPLAILAWYDNGPLQHGWAKRAGTPTTLIAGSKTNGRVLTSAVTTSPPTSFTASISGSVSQVRQSDGLVMVRIPLRLRGAPGGAARIDLRGIPSDQGVSMTASGVSFVPATTRAAYLGSVVALSGSDVVADVADSAGDRLQLHFSLSIDNRANTVTGTVTGHAV
jgi:sulfoxide reductase heme-binding subunit YedZ